VYHFWRAPTVGGNSDCKSNCQNFFILDKEDLIQEESLTNFLGVTYLARRIGKIGEGEREEMGQYESGGGK
jgi:hypothetical protein